MQRIHFSVNEYDQDGASSERVIYLTFGDTKIRVCSTVKAFDDVVKNILDI
jgi:hypothetical protein